MLKKRSKAQIELSLAVGDNTGGYKFFAWVLYNKTVWIKFLAPIVLFTAGIVLLTPFAMEQTYNEQFQIAVSIVLFIVSPIWMYFTVREYNELKHNIAR